MNNMPVGDCDSEMSRPVDMVITPKTPLHKETISRRPLQEKKEGKRKSSQFHLQKYTLAMCIYLNEVNEEFGPPLQHRK
jgi:hypothetical protein